MMRTVWIVLAPRTRDGSHQTSLVDVLWKRLPVIVAPPKIAEPKQTNVVEVEAPNCVRTSNLGERVIMNAAASWTLDEVCIVGTSRNNAYRKIDNRATRYAHHNHWLRVGVGISGSDD